MSFMSQIQFTNYHDSFSAQDQEKVRFICCHIQSTIMIIVFLSPQECTKFFCSCCVPEYQYTTTELTIPYELWHTMFKQLFCSIQSPIDRHLIRRMYKNELMCISAILMASP